MRLAPPETGEPAPSVRRPQLTTVTIALAGLVSLFLLGSIARTLKTYLPGQTVLCQGDVHGVNGSVLSRHWNVEPCSVEQAEVLPATSVTFALRLVV
jgi:hypothetical protein